MPIYEYRCTSCGHLLEVIQRLDEKPLSKCTECSGKLEKLISRTAFHLKGGGWFNEGYGGGSKPAPPSDSGESGSSDSGKKKASAGGCGGGACGCH